MGTIENTLNTSVSGQLESTEWKMEDGLNALTTGNAIISFTANLVPGSLGELCHEVQQHQIWQSLESFHEDQIEI